jgi:hypothetical protein
MIGIAVTQAMTELHPNIIGNAGNVIVFWPYLFYTAFNVTWGPLAWLVRLFSNNYNNIIL